MKYRLSLFATIFAALLLFAGAGFAQNQPNPNFMPTGTAPLSVTSTSASIPLPTTHASSPQATTVLIQNTGTVDARVVVGGSSVVASSSSYLVPAGQWRAWYIGSQSYIAAITASSTTTLDITTGTGVPAGGSLGGSGGGSGGDVNLIKVGGAAIALGSTTASAGVPIAFPSDQTLGITGSVTATGSISLSAGTAAIGSLTAGSAVIGHTINDTGSTTAVTSLPAVTGNGTFATQAQPTPVTSGGLTPCYVLSVNTVNATNCKNGAGQVYHVLLWNASTTIAYLRLYNLSAVPTCSSATGFVRSIIFPAPASGGGGVSDDIALGEAYSAGIGFCITLNAASNDNNAVAANSYGATVFLK